MPENDHNFSTPITDAESAARSKIGRQVTYFALSTTSLLGITAILVAILSTEPAKEKFIYVKDILTIILPLVGTWVGTVLAFYFSRENFAVAARQTAELVRQLSPEQRLQSIGVSEVMLDMDSATTTKLILSTTVEATSIKVKADIIEGLLEKNRRNRLPIVDGKGKVLYILHRNYIDQFLLKRSENGATHVADATLQDLLDAEGLAAIFQAFATVGTEARLIAVKQQMDGNRNCSDAFVTNDGTSSSKSVGWITNVIVQERSAA